MAIQNLFDTYGLGGVHVDQVYPESSSTERSRVRRRATSSIAEIPTVRARMARARAFRVGKPGLIAPTTLAEAGLTGIRPPDTSLDTALWRRRFPYPLLGWEHSLAGMKIE